jgi:hypothetical protein
MTQAVTRGRAEVTGKGLQMPVVSLSRDGAQSHSGALARLVGQICRLQADRHVNGSKCRKAQTHGCRRRES